MNYCVSDIHGCYDEFMALLEKMNFSESDTLYILGDVIDRGNGVTKCLDAIRREKNIHCLMGNHEAAMLRYHDRRDSEWMGLGNISTLQQEWRDYVDWVRGWPNSKTVVAGGRRFFLSHAGLDPKKPLRKQTADDLTWSRGEFYKQAGPKSHFCVFGHTPTAYIRYTYNCAIWFDEKHRDKACIDCGCVFGGALGALRLDDGAVFYAKALGKRNRKSLFRVENSTVGIPIFEK